MRYFFINQKLLFTSGSYFIGNKWDFNAARLGDLETLIRDPMLDILDYVLDYLQLLLTNITASSFPARQLKRIILIIQPELKLPLLLAFLRYFLGSKNKKITRIEQNYP